MNEKTTLALDIGTNSIGWAVVSEDEKRIVAAGVRVFPEGVDRDQKGGEIPKNQQRRMSRGMRRQVARRARRRKVVRQALVAAGLLPPEADGPAADVHRRRWEDDAFARADPYVLRRRALDEKLHPFEIGRLLLHLTQRRGFLSNRKGDRQKKKEDSDLLKEISVLQQSIHDTGDRTLGEHLARRQQDEPDRRVRGLHTHRQMYLAEFEAIWQAQAPHHPELLTDQLKWGSVGPQEYPAAPRQTGGGAARLLARFGLHGLIFFQRPMYWPKSVVGRCELDPKQKRCPRADRVAQEFRILLEVNNLRIITAGGEELQLTDDQRQTVLGLLMQKDKVTFDELRKKLGLGERDGFNLEAGGRSKLDGHVTDAALKKCAGKAWLTRPDDERNAIVQSLIHDEERTFRLRAKPEWGIDNELADRLLDAHLPEGFSSYGRLTIERLLPHLRRGMPLLSRDGRPCAVREAGYLAPWDRPIKGGSSLGPPPKMTNPIVGQALYEVRKVVNAIVREYGKPSRVVVELAREAKGSAAQRDRQSREMHERRQRRDAAAERIGEAGLKPTRAAIERVLLWDEQQGVCIYSGLCIGLAQLLGGEADVDHILPYSQSLDNSLMNKVVCFRRENADKAQRTVHGWLAESDPKKYEQVLQRAARLPIDIRNRKLPRFSQPTCELEQFITRQLTDTAFITSTVKQYLEILGCDVICSKGQMTAELRHQWGVNDILRDDALDVKNRDDHRHHALDAIIIALTTRPRLQKLARRGGEKLALPWETFWEDAQRAVAAINVSHRARRKVAGALHEDTVYGATQKVAGGTIADRPWAKGWKEAPGVYVLRKPLTALSLGEVARIRDDRVREVVEQRLEKHGLKPGRKAGEDAAGGRKIPPAVWTEPLYLTPRRGVGTATHIRSVRLLKPEDSIVPLGTTRVKYVKPGSLHHLVIFECDGPKGKSRREAVFVSMLEASRRVTAREPLIRREHPTNPAARFVMSLSRGETVRGVFKDAERLVRFVTAASTQGQLYFAEHSDARPSGTLVKYAVKASTLKAHKVIVDVIGRVYPAND
jgi:CRISPR-associated endonuclease Csn1